MFDQPLQPSFFSSARRKLLYSAAVGVVAALSPSFVMASAWKQVQAIREAVGDAPVSDDGVELTLPLVAEDGSSVPLSIKSKGQADGERIEKLAIFAPANPTPEVAVFEFGPEIDEIDLMTRIRLSESQTVIALAYTTSGKIRVSERPVRVTTSGCIAPAQSDPSNEMQARVRTPKSWKPGSPGEILTLISHPMTTGLAQDAQGNIPETRIIERFETTLGGRPVLTARFFRSLAANPYLKFAMRPQAAGELKILWTEDTGRKAEHVEPIALG